MGSGDEYRVKAAEISARVNQETHLLLRTELERLALAYLRLADQADLNAQTDIVYETPDRSGVQQQQQQQQQQQSQPPKSKAE